MEGEREERGREENERREKKKYPSFEELTLE